MRHMVPVNNTNVSKIDLHLHSYASNVTDYYTTNLLSIPESYSDPVETYWILKSKGMGLVTLTDHNSIDGILEILNKGLPDAFISCEFTATFPEDGCNVHITVLNMTETQFHEIERLRRNVYEMLSYVNAEIRAEALDPTKNKIAYFVTHPLMSTQNRPYGRMGALSLKHIEKLLLLCNCLEVQNGTRCKDLNDTTLQLVQSLNRKTIEKLANRYNIEPIGNTPWLKAIVGGSDDHSGINPGETFTTFPIENPEKGPQVHELIQAIRNRETTPCGAHGGPVNIAHAMVKIMYHHQTKSPVSAKKSKSLDDSLYLLLRFAFDQDSISLPEKIELKVRAAFHQWFSNSPLKTLQRQEHFEKVLSNLALELILSPEFQERVKALSTTDEKIFAVVSHLLNRIFQHYVAKVTDLSSFNLMATIKDVIALVFSNIFVSMPYFIAYSNQSADQPILRDVRKAYRLKQKHKVVLVTDTFFEINGVSRTIRKMIRESIRRHIDFTVVTCLGEEECSIYMKDPEIQDWVKEKRLKIFKSVTNMAFPEYDDLQIRFLPLLEFMKFVQEERFTMMQISTPGTIGIAGLMTAKMIQIPTSATYHTCFPEYVESYTNDVALEAIAWKYMILFYHSVDEVVVPSKFVAGLLHARGLLNRKLLILDRWVDHDHFHPQNRMEGFWREFGLEDETNKVKFIYIGRVAVEKDLYTLAHAYKKLLERQPAAHLIIVGDGPYLNKLKALLNEVPVTFTGFLSGNLLAKCCASADVKVFPSTTDTWGNAVLEAQASGLPVIVSSKGGPQELMEVKQTGLKFKAKDIDNLADVMEQLMDDELRQTMAKNARQYILDNDVTQPFSAILDSEAYRKQLKQLKKLKKGKTNLHHLIMDSKFVPIIEQEASEFSHDLLN